MIEAKHGTLFETSYSISDEAKAASIFGIGNGYFGIRGSFEEFGEDFIQGTYVRGLFDEITEIPATLSTNSYMKRFYFDQEKRKHFEKEDSCVNIGDIQAFRIYIDGKVFLPWEYEILSYDRHFDFSDGSLIRTMVVQDEEGHQTSFSFYKCASFANNHLFFQELSIEKLNHDLPIDVKSGMDLLIKTNGQRKAEVRDVLRDRGMTFLDEIFGPKYSMQGFLGFKNEIAGFSFLGTEDLDSFYGERYRLDKKKGGIRKLVAFYFNRDVTDPFNQSYALLSTSNYQEAKDNSFRAYQTVFKEVDIKVEGDDELDSLVRYASYQTLIGFDRFENVHSLSAKNLTSEKYNQFVWWDAEIYQFPFFLMHFPKESKSLLGYRVRSLPYARQNARKEGMEGAKFAFCSSVKGDEQVWIYARHPFLQIHINADVAYGVLNYYRHTKDEMFLKRDGLKLMNEVLLYFSSRSVRQEGKLHLLSVTGTDEHHDYVDDDAYTNMLVSHIAKEFLRLSSLFSYPIEGEEAIEKLAEDLYFPAFEKGILPQFKGYLSLEKNLVLEGKGTPGFQMKQSGLYHLSQTIKQPDVLLLYTMVDVGLTEHYEENYHYYLEKCEASSSLTYPVHALAALENGDIKTFEENLLSLLKVDIADVQPGTKEGIHAGCLAGSHLVFFRGLAGIHVSEDGLVISPHHYDKIKSFDMRFHYQGSTIQIHYDETGVLLQGDRPFHYRDSKGLVAEGKKAFLPFI